MAKSRTQQNGIRNKSSKTENQQTSKSNVVRMPLNFTPPELSNGDLGTVQDILFGKQMAAHTNQLRSLQKHMEDQINELHARWDTQFSELHVKLGSDAKIINTQFTRLEADQGAHISDMKQSIKSSESALAKKLHQETAELEKAHKQLVSQLETSNDRLTTALQTNHNELIQQLETAIDMLNSQKLDKSALSNLLGDVALQLNGRENAV